LFRKIYALNVQGVDFSYYHIAIKTNIMLTNHYNKISNILFALVIFISVTGCSKQDYRPGYAEGTKYPTIHLSGYTLETMQVHVGPRSVVAGYVSEEISDVKYEVPFAAAQDVNRVVFYKEDGSVPYTGSQIRFETPGKDTSVKIFYDGKTFFQNPVFPAPTAGKMGLRITFKSQASTYKGAVDLELHDIYDTRVTKIDPATGKPFKDSKGKDILFDTVLVKPAVSLIVRNIKSTEFTTYIELPTPATPRANPDDPIRYAFYVRKANTTESLPYPANVTPPTYDYLDFLPDYYAIYTLIDVRLNTTNPASIVYKIDDRTTLFQ
jgi:hypothetical protein